MPDAHHPKCAGSADLGHDADRAPEGCEAALTLLGQLVDRARAAGMTRLRLVVFSDYPLRQSLWCGKPAYQARGCKLDPDLEDRRVPLIVGTFGAEPPDLSRFDSNAQVFGLAVSP